MGHGENFWKNLLEEFSSFNAELCNSTYIETNECTRLSLRMI